MSSDPTLPAKTLGQIYSQARSLSGIAPLASLDLYSPLSPQLTPSPNSRSSLYPAEFAKAASLNDGSDSETLKNKPVDPLIFDILLSNELNRKLKKNFGLAFVIITCVFTAVSYAIIVLTALYHWNLPSAALTALVIQAPLQMIGILYIMAKNLFPNQSLDERTSKKV